MTPEKLAELEALAKEIHAREGRKPTQGGSSAMPRPPHNPPQGGAGNNGSTNGEPSEQPPAK